MGQPLSSSSFSGQVLLTHCIDTSACARRHLTGMVAVSDFHDSLYAFAFCILPSHRKQVRAGLCAPVSEARARCYRG